jgi:hypothetical protein
VPGFGLAGLLVAVLVAVIAWEQSPQSAAVLAASDYRLNASSHQLRRDSDENGNLLTLVSLSTGRRQD